MNVQISGLPLKGFKVEWLESAFDFLEEELKFLRLYGVEDVFGEISVRILPDADFVVITRVLDSHDVEFGFYKYEVERNGKIHHILKLPDETKERYLDPFEEEEWRIGENSCVNCQGTD